VGSEKKLKKQPSKRFGAQKSRAVPKPKWAQNFYRNKKPFLSFRKEALGKGFEPRFTSKNDFERPHKYAPPNRSELKCNPPPPFHALWHDSGKKVRHPACEKHVFLKGTLYPLPEFYDMQSGEKGEIAKMSARLISWRRFFILKFEGQKIVIGTEIMN